jgi:hypothetical protein
MNSILLVVLALWAAPQEPPWQDLALSIERDFSNSSDTVTLCRVRVVNRGTRSWPGSHVRFEALALDGGVVMARERGRFGHWLAPHDTLETVIAFDGLYRSFEVRLLFKDLDGSHPRRRSGARPKHPKTKGKKGS